MGRFKLSKNNTYWVCLKHEYRMIECNIKGVTTLQELKNKAYIKFWVPKYHKDGFPSKMIIEDINGRRRKYPITFTGNVRTSK